MTNKSVKKEDIKYAIEAQKEMEEYNPNRKKISEDEIRSAAEEIEKLSNEASEILKKAMALSEKYGIMFTFAPVGRYGVCDGGWDHSSM